MTPDWLRAEIVKGLQALLVLRLRGAPAVDTVQALANVWVAAIASRPIHWVQDRDTERVRQAFLTLTATADSWPAPAALIAAIPPAAATQNLLERPQSRSMPAHIRQQIDAFLRKVRV